METLEIWPRETGITDLPEDLSRLTLASMEELRRDWAVRRAEMEELGILQTFSDQLAREWAIETGQIENLYNIERGVTMSLIEQGFNAALLERGSTNKPPEYVLALLNDQRDALEGLFEFVKQDRPLSTSYIKELHAAMTRSQALTEAIDPQGNLVDVPLLRGEWKKTPNFPIRDGKLFMYCPPEQTLSEMDRLVQMHVSQMEKEVPSEAMAAWLHHRFTQIHPFQDGNGRVARALASLVLIRAQMFPLVVPLEEKEAYLDSLEAADQNDLRPLLLFFARRQQQGFSKANLAAVKLMPNSFTSTEAARRLAQAVRIKKLGPSTGEDSLVEVCKAIHLAFIRTLEQQISSLALQGIEADVLHCNEATQYSKISGASIENYSNLKQIANLLDVSPLDPGIETNCTFQHPVSGRLALLTFFVQSEEEEHELDLCIVVTQGISDQMQILHAVHYGRARWQSTGRIGAYASQMADSAVAKILDFWRSQV